MQQDIYLAIHASEMSPTFFINRFSGCLVYGSYVIDIFLLNIMKRFSFKMLYTPGICESKYRLFFAVVHTYTTRPSLCVLIG